MQYSYWLRAGISGFLTPMETRIFLSLQTGRLLHPVSCKMCIFYLSRVYSDQGVVLDTHTRPFSVSVLCEYGYNSTALVDFITCFMETFTLTSHFSQAADYCHVWDSYLILVCEEDIRIECPY